MKELTQRDEYISNELQRFNITDTAIDEMNKQYSKLEIKDIEDKQGFLDVRAARLDVKNKRIEVEKRRKEITEDALYFQRAINQEAKRITALLEPIENTLNEMESKYEAEKEAIKKEKERLIEEEYKERYNALLLEGMKFNGVSFYCENTVLEKSMIAIKNMTGLEFSSYFYLVCEFNREVIKKQEAMLIESAAKERMKFEEEEKKRIELEAIEKERAQKLEQEKIELEKIRKAQEEEANRLITERELLEVKRLADENNLKLEKEKIELEKLALKEVEDGKMITCTSMLIIDDPLGPDENPNEKSALELTVSPSSRHEFSLINETNGYVLKEDPLQPARLFCSDCFLKLRSAIGNSELTIKRDESLWLIFILKEEIKSNV